MVNGCLCLIDWCWHSINYSAFHHHQHYCHEENPLLFVVFVPFAILIVSPVPGQIYNVPLLFLDLVLVDLVNHSMCVANKREKKSYHFFACVTKHTHTFVNWCINFLIHSLRPKHLISALSITFIHHGEKTIKKLCFHSEILCKFYCTHTYENFYANVTENQHWQQQKNSDNSSVIDKTSFSLRHQFFPVNQSIKKKKKDKKLQSSFN